MKDVTATSFGLVIAFLLPGLTGLYALSYWVPEVNALLNQMWTAETSAGSFLLITLAALTIGLQVTLIRWLLFERWLCREQTLSAREFQALAKEAMLPAYEAAVDQHYRYHPF